MSHTCRLHPAGTIQLEACCQYGADVDLAERDAIVERKEEIQRLLTIPPTDWFTKVEQPDPDFPSGKIVRTQKHGQGCIFLQHDKRGCAIHRAAFENGWDFRLAKPAICRLFPVTFTDDSIELSDDYADYSCNHEQNNPTIYEVCRTEVQSIFGDNIVTQLDSYLKQYGKQNQHRTLPVVPS